MKQRCIDAVTKAIGRDLTKPEITDIEERILREKRYLALRNQTKYQAMSEAERLTEAAKMAAKGILEEAEKKKQRIERTLAVNDQIQTYMQGMKAKFPTMSGLEALERYLGWFADFKNMGQSLESLHNAITADYTRRLVEVYEGIGPKAFGLFQNRAGTTALIYELFGQDGSLVAPPAIAKAAKAVVKPWLETMEEMRQHYNRLGGEIGKLRDWRFPQVHDQLRVAKAGAEQWINDVLSFGLKTELYIKPDGNFMTPTEIREALREAWLSISTGGANDIEPGARGNPLRAKRHADNREVHFKNPDGFIKYQEKYGTGDAYSVMMGHVKTLSRDIAVLEKFGPNADLMFDTWLDRVVQTEKLANPQKANYGKIDGQAVKVQNLYDYLSGRTLPVANQKLAATFDTLRSWVVATKMGSAFISSLPDNATMRMTAFINNIPELKLARNQLAYINPANKNELKMAQRVGLSLDTMLGEVNRWGADQFGPRWSGKAASLTMRVSGLNAVTEGRRRAFGVSMMGSVGSTVKRYQKLADIKTMDKKVLAGSGITEDVFKVWKMAEQEDWGNGNDTMLTPESIYRIPDAKLVGMPIPDRNGQLRAALPEDVKAIKTDAALKLLGMVLDETNMAVMMTDARQRAWLAGWRKGTWSGEIVASFMLLKGMPLALLRKNFSRGVYGMDTNAGKAAYLATFVASTTILGAVAAQIVELINGRDPKDVTAPKFWGAALLKGGSLGVYGDFLFQTNTSYGNTPLATASGPVASYLEDMINLSQGSLIRAAQGKETKFLPNLVQFVKGNVPLQNLWYTRAVTDRLIFNNLQDMASPGYVRRTEMRLKRDYDQDFWWKMNEPLPERAPNLQRAVGER